MAKELIDRFIEHPRHGVIVWVLGGLFGLLFVLPAWDEFAAARENGAKRRAELEEITKSVENFDALQAQLAAYESQTAPLPKTIDSESADRIRQEVTRLAQQMRCQIRRLNLSDPIVQPWRPGDDPFATSVGVDGQPHSTLEIRTLTLTVDGNLTQLTKLTIALNDLGPFAVPSDMTLRREGIDGQLMLEVDISLFHLTGTFD